MEAVPTSNCNELAQLDSVIRELVPSSEFSFRIQTSTWREIFHCAYLDIFPKDRPEEIVFERSVAGKFNSTGLIAELRASTLRDLPDFFTQPRQSLPAGNYSVYLPPAHGGLLLHEAIGHMLEARPNGLFRHKQGESVAPEFVTVVDDPTLPSGFGSFDFDDDGHPAVRKTLIRNGRVESFLDRRGNLRRERGHFPLAPRMSNTYLETRGFPSEPIEHKAEIAIRRFGGGRADHRTGRFELIVREAWRRVNGSNTALLPFMIRGHALDLLKNIKALAGATEFYPSFCHGISGTVPVSYGQPGVLVSELECRPVTNQQPWRITC